MSGDGGFLEQAGDVFLGGVDKAIDREFSDGDPEVKNPEGEHAETTADGMPQDHYESGAPGKSQRAYVAGLPWDQALLVGSVGLLTIGLVFQFATRG